MNSRIHEIESYCPPHTDEPSTPCRYVVLDIRRSKRAPAELAQAFATARDLREMGNDDDNATDADVVPVSVKRQSWAGWLSALGLHTDAAGMRQFDAPVAARMLRLAETAHFAPAQKAAMQAAGSNLTPYDAADTLITLAFGARDDVTLIPILRTVLLWVCEHFAEIVAVASPTDTVYAAKTRSIVAGAMSAFLSQYLTQPAHWQTCSAAIAFVIAYGTDAQAQALGVCPSFAWACGARQVHAAQRLLRLAEGAPRQALMAAPQPWIVACANGHFDVVQGVWESLSATEREAWIAADDYAAFRMASQNGHVGITSFIFVQARNVGRMHLLEHATQALERDSASAAQAAVFLRLFRMHDAPDQRAILRRGAYRAFRAAVRYGLTSLALHLLHVAPRADQVAMLHAHSGSAVSCARQHGHALLARRLAWFDATLRAVNDSSAGVT